MSMKRSSVPSPRRAAAPFVALAAAGMALASCGQQQTAVEPTTAVIGRVTESGVAAEVNGQRIYVDDVRQLMIQMGDLKDNEDVDTNDPRFHLRLQTLIDARLLADEAVRRGLDQDPDVQHSLALARDTVLASTMRQTLRAAVLDEATIAEEYRKLSETISREQVVKVRHILFDTREAAQAAKARLDQGESFAQLALLLSRDRETASEGGDMGLKPVDNLIGGLRELAASAPIGEPAGPAQSERGWHLVLVEERANRTPQSLEQLRPYIQVYLAQQEERRIAEELRRNARISEMDFAEQGVGPAPGLTPPAPVEPIGPGAVPAPGAGRPGGAPPAARETPPRPPAPAPRPPAAAAPPARPPAATPPQNPPPAAPPRPAPPRQAPPPPVQDENPLQ